MKGSPRIGSTPRRVRGQYLSQASMLAARILIVFTAVLLVVMPLTEHLWSFDGLVCGGQDFEFGLLSIVTILCLVLVVSQHRKQGLAFLLSVRRWLWSVFCGVDLMLSKFSGSLVAVVAESLLESTALGGHSLPLRI